MRPLSIKIRGLRSYRDEVEIDFSGRDLVAIIGDTGSGKSSVLEALCFALYGSATWAGNAVRDLISTGAPALSVELKFRADGRDWTVSRTVQAGSGGSLHSLKADDGASPHIDKAQEVTAAVRRLVGLDRDTFLRSVILPQGRFQELLQMRGSDRTGVLKEIFRVDELDRVKVEARIARDRIAIPLADERAKRGKFFDDPAEVEGEATAAVDEARARLDILETADLEIRQSTEAAADGRRLAARLEAHASAIAEARRPGDAGRLAELSALEASLAGPLADAAAHAARHEATASVIAEELAGAERSGLGPAGLAGALKTLENAAAALPELEAEAAMIERERTELDALDAAVGLAERAAPVLTAELASAVAEAAAAEARARAATAVADSAGAALRSARRIADDHAAAAAEAERCAGERARLAHELADAAAAHALAAAAIRAAESRLEEVRRKDHAAAAAAGHSPGDPCPVCARALPAGFAPPHAEDEGEARTLRQAAAEEEQRALGLSKRLEGLAQAAETAAAAAVTRRTQSAAALDAAMVGLRRVLPAANLAAADDDLLAPLDAAAREQLEAVEAARRLVQEAQAAQSTAEARLSALQTDFARRSRETARREATLHARRGQQAAALTALPASVRPGNGPAALELEAARGRAFAQLEAIWGRERQREEADAAARAARADRDALTARIQAEVAGPLATVAAVQSRLDHCLGLVARDLEIEPPGPYDDASIAEAAAARDLAAVEMLRRCATGVDEAAAGTAAAGKRIAAALERSGCTGPDDLRRTTIQVATDLRHAETRRDEARRQVPLVASLDSRLAGATALVAALDVVDAHLSDAKFIAYVIRRRQQVLLAVASELFGSMTNDRYGFAEDFRIVDRWSGQPRDVMTLSGGETFLASLSLALALVELAGRGGGRLEALFLDEGFGSLDANTLPDALKALENQASGGRLVAVISHLRAVAETIEHVLQVTRVDGTSQARWLTGQQRDALLGDDAESGLLA